MCNIQKAEKYSVFIVLLAMNFFLLSFSIHMLTVVVYAYSCVK